MSQYQRIDMGTIEALKEHLDIKSVFHYQELPENFLSDNMEMLEESGENICETLILNTRTENCS